MWSEPVLAKVLEPKELAREKAREMVALFGADRACQESMRLAEEAKEPFVWEVAWQCAVLRDLALPEEAPRPVPKPFEIDRLIGEGSVVLAVTEGARWEVRRGKSGRVYCTCPAWRFERAPIDQRCCKHMRAMLERGELTLKENSE